MNKETLFLILAMAWVTYIPRLIPALFLDKIALSRRAEKFLRLIPYTAMAALIFPGILTVDPQNPAIGAVGGLACLVATWLKPSVPLAVLVAVTTVVLMYLL